MRAIAYGAIGGIVAGVVCFGTGFLIVTAIGVPEGSYFGVGIEPWNLPGTLLGAGVWFHMLALMRKRGVPAAIVSMVAYNGVRIVAWGFCLEMLWQLFHAHWREALACFIAYWVFGLIQEHVFERHKRIPGLNVTQAELAERLSQSKAPVVTGLRKWQRWGQTALVLFGVFLAVMAYLER